MIRGTKEREGRGQGMVEYGLILGLIAVMILAFAMYILPDVRKLYQDALTPETVSESSASLSAGVY
ncbi:MAG: Flp family type IVb pilin [Candidatus Hydrogenedentota bacterium]|nr:MAG: Flp family type IVb pilin [Candidatus Hydrogenedentota bacterium]